jgi:signal transduction histidine kinase
VTTDQFQQIADFLPSGALLLSDEGTILAANSAVKSAWGLEPVAIVGQSLASLLRTSADEMATFVQACMESGKDASLQATLVSTGKSVAFRGRTLHASSAADRSEILLVEQAGKTSHAAQQVAGEEIDMRDRLLALLVHDFRNGLASVPMGLDVLEIEHGRSETVALLRRQIGQLVQLVDEVLDVSRLLRGKIVLRPEPVVLQEIVQEASTKLTETLRKHSLELILSLPPEMISISVDPQRTIQILRELVLQRSKNMAAGGQLTLSLSRDSNEVLLRLQDTGQAINQKLMPHVFDLNAQFRYASQENRTQLELGLALAGGLVALHGGRIHAHSLATPPGMETFIHLPAPV